MGNQLTWLLDFDETLASGNLTWALQQAFPKFIRDNHLAVDSARLQQTMLTLQERARQTPNSALLLGMLFETMGWPRDLQSQLLEDIKSNYRPALFEDALPFLERLRQGRQRVYIVSNNKHTPEHIQLVGIEPYIQGVFTPFTCPDTQPKPHVSLWNYIAKHEAGIDPRAAVIVGDDPWSDGRFADACQLPCWIVDRMQRFSEMVNDKPYRWIQSLREIPI